MRKFLTVCLCSLFVSISLFAQDIIVTNDARKIEAKILEVSKTEIKYKDKNNLNGPTFILETKEISSIIYSNGQVKVYNNEIAQKTSEELVNATATYDESTAQVLLLSGQTLTVQITDMKSNYVAYILDGKPYTMPASQIKTVTFLRNGQVREYQHTGSTPHAVPDKLERENTNTVIVKSHGYYYMGDKKMTEDQYLHFIYSNCHDVWEDYKKGCKLWKTGWGLFGAGMGCLIIGIPMTIVGYSNAFQSRENTSGLHVTYPDVTAIGACIAGAAFAGFGLCFTIASIPCLSIGANKRNNSHTIYNERCLSRSETLTLKVQTSQNGVGLALAF